MFIILQEDHTVYMKLPNDVPDELIDLCRAQLPEMQRTGRNSVVPYSAEGTLYTVSGKSEIIDERVYYVFRCQPSTVQIKSRKTGIRTLVLPECEQLFMNSFFTTSGVMGELEQRINTLAVSHQPVMIIGEQGTGKEQIARLLYMRSRYTHHPMVVVNCSTVDERGWDYLLGSQNSPLASYGNTIYFQYLEEMPAARQPELLSIILDMNLTSRAKFIFSCSCLEDVAIPEVATTFSFRLGCLSVHMPSLRKRIDEIPSLANLYLKRLNTELGKELAGFAPGSMEQLQRYDWPNNYTQFKHVLYELASLTTSAYIHSTLVAEFLAKERALTRSIPSITAYSVPVEGRTLEQITLDAVLQALSYCHGNQTAAARMLGISRSTLWRYMNQHE